jgi:hypothetical protein
LSDEERAIGEYPSLKVTRVLQRRTVSDRRKLYSHLWDINNLLTEKLTHRPSGGEDRAAHGGA